MLDSFQREGRYRILSNAHTLLPISDYYMFMLIDIHLLQDTYPGIHELILNKLHNDEIPLPHNGPVSFLEYIGEQATTLYATRGIRTYPQKNGHDDELFRSWDWNRIRRHISATFEYWYYSRRAREINNMFGRTPGSGHWYKAFEYTYDSASFYTRVALRVAYKLNQRGLEIVTAEEMIKRFSREEEIVWEETIIQVHPETACTT
jgi:hypothetical protein